MKKTEDKSVIYKSLWIMGTVMILAVLIIELVSIFLIQRDRRKTERLFSNTIESYGQFWEDKFASTSKSASADERNGFNTILSAAVYFERSANGGNC